MVRPLVTLAAAAVLLVPLPGRRAAADPQAADAAGPPGDDAGDGDPVAAADGDEPVARPADDPCGVHIVRAPDDLRAAVAARLAADASACAGTLDVWLIPTDGGVYVQARDRIGRVRERVVADAATAATLLASWVEVDAARPLWDPPRPPRIAEPTRDDDGAAGGAEPAARPADDAVATAPVTRATLLPPAATAPGVTTTGVGVAPAPGRRTWSIAALSHVTGSGMAGVGGRVQVDLLRRGRWQLGAAATGLALGASPHLYAMPLDPQTTVEETGRTSLDLEVTMRRSWRLGRIDVTPSVALGAGAARHQLWMSGRDVYGDALYSVGPRVEGAITASTHLRGRWRVEAGAGTSLAGHRQLVTDTDRIPVYLDGGTTVLVGLRHE
ncbi:MAG: hypothetical protein H6709_09735 [Kofleriaceae bacterium]|nr:hypothetical protein [Kofleriaceae bacterium]